MLSMSIATQRFAPQLALGQTELPVYHSRNGIVRILVLAPLSLIARVGSRDLRCDL